ncbi:MAG: 4-hydroxy-tetrahydrodipicolinate synthase [Steroidobacteraceae bacterium]
MSSGTFTGSMPAIVTPMLADGGIDFPAWARLIEFHLGEGTPGIVIGGTTGESPTLTDAELRELVVTARRQAAGRLQIIVGTGTNNTAETVRRTLWVNELKPDAQMYVTPAYNKPPQEGLYQHFAAAAAASTVPVILYNVPPRTGVDLQPTTAARLSQLPGIVALKEAVPSIERIRELVATCRPGFQVLSGDDPTAREAVMAGACGLISVTANVAPKACSELIAAALAGDRTLAAQIDERLTPLNNALFLESNPIAVKWALQQMGLIGGAIRLPLVPLAPAHHRTVLNALRYARVNVTAAATSER